MGVQSHNRDSEEQKSGDIPFKIYTDLVMPFALTASLIPVGLGTMLGYKNGGHFDLKSMLLMMIAAVSIQAAMNLVNNYYDTQKGVEDSDKDTNRVYVNKVLNSLSPATLEITTIMHCVLSVVAMSKLMGRINYSTDFTILALIYFIAILMYAMRPGIKLLFLNDLAIMSSFGPFLTGMAYLAQGPTSVPPHVFLASIPICCNIAAMLQNKNARDRPLDLRDGVYSMATLMNKGMSDSVFILLVITPVLFFLRAGIVCSPYLLLPLVTIPIITKAINNFRNGVHLARDTGKLLMLQGLLYILGLALTTTAALEEYFM